MRHLKRTAKLGRTGEHRNAMLANLVCSLILHGRITTTVAKAKAARSVAEKMVSLGKSGTVHDRRLAAARIHQEQAVKILFNEIAPVQKERHGGYTRIVRLGQRQGDASAASDCSSTGRRLRARRARARKRRKREKAAAPAEAKA